MWALVAEVLSALVFGVVFVADDLFMFYSDVQLIGG